MSILVIDGVKYEEWTPASEDDFERVAKEHAQDIFGEQSIYLDIRHKLKSRSGIVAIPDGYVVVLGQQPCWHIVEVELSSHPLYEHIVPQVSKFINGVKNPATQKDIVSALYQEIDSDEFLRLRLTKAIGTTETYKFLADLVSQSPVVTVIVERHTEQLDEAIGALAHAQIKTVELQTFAREGVGLAVHAHLFEPLHRAVAPSVTTVRERSEVVPAPSARSTLEVVIRTPSFIKYNVFLIPRDKRSFFPDDKVPFVLETDIGKIETYMTGTYLSKNLTKWYRQHPTIKVGDKIIFEVIEPMKRYRLKVA
jgi:hypothetical protein